MPNKNYQQLQFSNEEEEKLIDLMKENPPLYGVKNKTYKDTELKENIWKTIAQELNKCVSDCKIKWKHIRDYYQRQRREGRKGTGSAAGSGSGNRFASLQFLEDSFVERQTISNVCTKKREGTYVEREPQQADDGSDGTFQDGQTELDLRESSQLESQQKDSESQHEYYSDNPDQIEDVHDSPRLSIPQSPPHIQKAMKTISSQSPPRKLTPRSEILKEIQKGRKERLDLLRSLKKTTIRQSKTSHPIDLFFQSMAGVVKKFPPRLMLQARSKVCNIIGELELEALIEQEATNAVLNFFLHGRCQQIALFHNHLHPRAPHIRLVVAQLHHSPSHTNPTRGKNTATIQFKNHLKSVIQLKEQNILY